MKKLKKLAALVLALTLVLGTSLLAGAVGENNSSESSSTDSTTNNATITIENSAKDVNYYAYKLFDASVTGTENGSIAYTGNIPTDLKDYFENKTDDGTSRIEATAKAKDSNGELSTEAIAALTNWANGKKTTGTDGTVTYNADGSVEGTGGTVQITGLAPGYYVVVNNRTGKGVAITVTSTNPNATIDDKSETQPSTSGNDKTYKMLQDDTKDTNVRVGANVGYTIRFATVNYVKENTTTETTTNTGTGDNNAEQSTETNTANDADNQTNTDPQSDAATPSDADPSAGENSANENGENANASESSNTDASANASASGSSTVKYTQVTKYVIEDTPTNLAVDIDNLVVKINNVEKTKDTDYKIEQDENTKVIKITIPWTKTENEKTVALYEEGAVVEVSYTAEVLHGAAESGASNTAVLYYNDIPFNGSGAKVDISTASVTLTKTDASGAKLDNAQFNLQKKTGTGSDGKDTYENVYVVEEKDTNGNVTGYHVADSTETNTKTITIVAGEVTIKGLDLDEEYQLVETEAPAGYNKLTAPKKIELNTDGKSFGPVTVENSTGSLLPSTGGMGTTIFFVAGGILVVGAMILLIARWRMKMEG